MRYFVAGNVWLLFAIVIWLGGENVGGPWYKTFGVGKMAGESVTTCIIGSVVIAIVFFVLTGVTRNKQAS